MIPHIPPPLIIKPRPLHQLRKRSIRRQPIITHSGRLRNSEEARRRHEHIDSLRRPRARRLGTLRARAAMRAVFPARCMSGRRIRIVIIIPRTNDRRRRRRIRRETRRESKVKLGRTVPHALYARREAMDRLLGALVVVDEVGCGVGGRLDRVRASAHEVCSCGVL
jgi:hypothetical protein